MTDGDRAPRRPPSSADATYVSGERVFGPPLGTFDVEWVAREVDRVTAAGYRAAHDWVDAAWRQAREGGLDPAALRTAVTQAGADASSAETVVAHVVAYCDTYDVDPASDRG